MQNAESDDIDAIAKRADVDRATAKAVLEAAEESEATCSICGAEDGDDTPVTWYDVPFQGARLLCWECFAQHIEEISLLSPTEAKVAALRLAGKSSTSVDDYLGLGEGQAATYMTRVRDKAEQAPIEIDRNKATQHLYDQLQSQQ